MSQKYHHMFTMLPELSSRYLPFSPWNAKWIGLLFLQKQRAEEQLHWISVTFCGEELWAGARGRVKNRVKVHHTSFLLSFFISL